MDRRDFRAGRAVLAVLAVLAALGVSDVVRCREALLIEVLPMEVLVIEGLVDVRLGTGVYSSSSSSSSSSSPPWLEGVGVVFPASSESGVDSIT